MKTTIIEGPRQSGKTTMLRKYLEEAVKNPLKIGIYAPFIPMTTTITDHLFPGPDCQIWWSSAMSDFKHQGTQFDIIVIDEISICKSAFMKGVLHSALICDADLLVTIEQETWGKLSPEVADLLDTCILKSANELTNH